VVVVQTWAIGNGYGISPPDTVTPLSGEISYYVVQLAFLVTTVAIAASLAVVRGAPAGGLPVGPWYRAAVAAAVCATGDLVLLAAWLTDASPVRVHSSEVAPPAQGPGRHRAQPHGCRGPRRGRRHGDQAAANQSAATR
jgi:hypothetical protein